MSVVRNRFEKRHLFFRDFDVLDRLDRERHSTSFRVRRAEWQHDRGRHAEHPLG